MTATGSGGRDWLAGWHHSHTAGGTESLPDKRDVQVGSGQWTVGSGVVNRVTLGFVTRHRHHHHQQLQLQRQRL